MSGRRRSGRRAILVAAVVAATGAGCGTTYSTVHNPTYSLPPAPREARLPPATRTAIDRTLRAFVASAVERRNPGAAFDLATASMRAGSSRADWAQGNLPVPPFAARTATATRYSVISATPRDADLRLLLQPRHPHRDGVIAYQIHVQRAGRRWLVDWFTPVAFFAPAGARPAITAEPDLGPQAGNSHQYQASHHASSVAWGLIALVASPLVTLALAGIVFGIRARRRRPRVPLDDAGWREALTTFRSEP